MKLKVVIADDEARVCQLIQVLADWEALGMEVVGVASNGLEALDRVNQLHPHILITDIRMPGCYGLDLIQQAKEKSPHLEVVIISGYAHFEYAQIAIKYGVGDYLLKPVQKKELMSTLQKLGDRCRQRQTATDEVDWLRKAQEEDTGRLRQQLLLDLSSGQLTAPTEQLLQSHYHLEVQPGHYQMICLKFDYPLQDFPQSSLNIVEEKSLKILETALKPHCTQLILHCRPPLGYGLLQFNPKKKDTIRRVLRDCINQLTAQQQLFGQVLCSLSLGEEVDRPEALAQSLSSAREALDNRLVDGTGRLLECSHKHSTSVDSKWLEVYDRSIAHVIESQSSAEISRASAQLQQQVNSQSDLSGHAILNLVQEAASLFALRLDVPEREQQLAQLSRGLGQCHKIPQLFELLVAFEEKHLATLVTEQENASIRPIRLAKQYIQTHYSENISLETVCASVGLSSSYFSAMFKKETKEGFAKYLTRVRMDRAKELLQQTNLSISDICIQVGYNDLKHFTSTFKKSTDLNPSQYRKLYG